MKVIDWLAIIATIAILAAILYPLFMKATGHYVPTIEHKQSVCTCSCNHV